MPPDHYKQFRKLLDDYGLTQQEVADILSESTGDPVPARTVRSWVNDRNSPSARRCPGWAVKLLRIELEGNQ